MNQILPPDAGLQLGEEFPELLAIPDDNTARARLHRIGMAWAKACAAAGMSGISFDGYQREMRQAFRGETIADQRRRDRIDAEPGA